MNLPLKSGSVGLMVATSNSSKPGRAAGGCASIPVATIMRAAASFRFEDDRLTECIISDGSTARSFRVQSPRARLPRVALPFVDLTPVTNSRHLHQQSCIIDGVHHAPIPHAYAPLAVSAFELLAAARTGIGGKILQARNNTRDQLAGQLFEFSL